MRIVIFGIRLPLSDPTQGAACRIILYAQVRWDRSIYPGNRRVGKKVLLCEGGQSRLITDNGRVGSLPFVPVDLLMNDRTEKAVHFGGWWWPLRFSARVLLQQLF